LALNEYFLPRFLEIDLAFRRNCATKSSYDVALGDNRTSLQVFRSALASQGALTRREPGENNSALWRKWRERNEPEGGGMNDGAE
jgi:hypothetical protein